MHFVDPEAQTHNGNAKFLFFPQPLNYEKKKTYTLNIEGANTHLDFRFSHLGPFKDVTMLKISVGDVDEPPVFTLPSYVMDVYENAKIGTVVGTVTAQDPDSTNNIVRYGAPKSLPLYMRHLTAFCLVRASAFARIYAALSKVL